MMSAEESNQTSDIRQRRGIFMRQHETAKVYWREQDTMEDKPESTAVDIFRWFWLFFAGGIAGVVIETIWCCFAFGGLSSRTSNLFFPFSIVWGVGAVLLLMLLNYSQKESTAVVFVGGCILAGIFEFICGFIGERILGVTFWDYTGLPLHLGRYVNVFICALWGVLCVVCQKWVFPFWNAKLISLLKKRSSKVITVFLIGFMVVTNAVSGMALLRMNARNAGNAAVNIVESLLDVYFPDKTLQQYFPKMKYLNGEKVYLPKEKREKNDYID